MTETRQNMEIRSGDTAVLAFIARDASGALVDLTGALLTFTIRRNGASANAVTKTTGNGIVIAADQATNTGQYTVTLDTTDTAALSGLYLHETEIVDVAGSVHTAATGSVHIIEDLIE